MSNKNGIANIEDMVQSATVHTDGDFNTQFEKLWAYMDDEINIMDVMLKGVEPVIIDKTNDLVRITSSLCLQWERVKKSIKELTNVT